MRGAAYHDLSSVQPLLSTYLLVSSFPDCSPHYSGSMALKKRLLNTLLLYTQPGHSPDTPCSSNSLWSQMLSQVCCSSMLLCYLLYIEMLIFLHGTRCEFFFCYSILSAYLFNDLYHSLMEELPSKACGSITFAHCIRE